MSYCGVCGTFYNPTCPRWPQCAPAPNPHEAEIAAAMADTVALAAQAAALTGHPANHDPLQNIAEQARMLANQVRPK